VIRVLAAGIDSLYLSVRGELRDGVLQVFDTMRSFPLNEDEPVPFHFRDEEGGFLLRQHGWRSYKTWLSSPRYELMLGGPKALPAAYVQLHSAFIHTVGVGEAIAEVVDVLGAHFFSGPVVLTPSRVDLYADTQGWAPRPEQFEHFVCRGVKRRLFGQPSERHASGRRLAGMTFGKGAVVARLYDKTLELSQRGQTWPSAIWQDHDPALPVWRVEFQFRRDALRSFGLSSVGDVLHARQALWEYGTRWLSLRSPTRAVRRSNWPEVPEWVEFRSVQLGEPCNALVRERIRQATERRLLSGWVGYTTSLAALGQETEIHAALRRVEPAAVRYLTERDVVFAELVEQKRRRLAIDRQRQSSQLRAGRPT